MTTLQFLISLAGATMLLLYAVRMVQTGIERAFGASFKRVMAQRSGRLQAAMAGLALAVALQSSAAVALLAASFASAGALSLAIGLALVLGADLGSAIVVKLLSFELDWLVPILLALGAGFVVKAERRRLRQAGRILLGIAFILIALRFLRETMDPIRDSAFLPAIAGYLAEDYITAFIVGAALAFVMHSSVAAILMCVTLVAIDAVPFAAGLSLVIGANFGGAAVPLWLTRAMAPPGRQIALGNFAVRGFGACIALILANRPAAAEALAPYASADGLVAAHLAFNAALLVFLPFTGAVAAACGRVFAPPAVALAGVEPLETQSALDERTLETPRLAVANLRREVLRMSQLVEQMIRPIIELYDAGDVERIKACRGRDRYVNDALSGVRRFAAAIPTENMDEDDLRRVRELTEYAINLELAGDIVSNRLLPAARDKAKRSISFSGDGWRELVEMHEAVVANMTLAFDVLGSEDLEAARLLVEAKSEMAKAERESRKNHLLRIRNGAEESLESSDLHLETLRGMKDLNSQVASIAYPILHRNGQLLETRLVTDADAEAT